MLSENPKIVRCPNVPSVVSVFYLLEIRKEFMLAQGLHHFTKELILIWDLGRAIK